MALVSRKLGAVTVVDVIRERFNSPLLGILSALIIVVFFYNNNDCAICRWRKVV